MFIHLHDDDIREHLTSSSFTRRVFHFYNKHLIIKIFEGYNLKTPQVAVLYIWQKILALFPILRFSIEKTDESFKNREENIIWIIRSLIKGMSWEDIAHKYTDKFGCIVTPRSLQRMIKKSGVLDYIPDKGGGKLEIPELNKTLTLLKTEKDKEVKNKLKVKLLEIAFSIECDYKRAVFILHDCLGYEYSDIASYINAYFTNNERKRKAEAMQKMLSRTKKSKNVKLSRLSGNRTL